MLKIICLLGSGEKVTIEWFGSSPDIDDLAEFLDTQYPDSGIKMWENDLPVYPLLDRTTYIPDNFPQAIAEIARLFGAYDYESWVDVDDHTTPVYRFVINDCGANVDSCERRLLAAGFQPEIAGSFSCTRAEFTIHDTMGNEPEYKPDTRAERRKATARKVNQREALMHSLGKKAGSLYNKRRQKIDRSTGYMRSGNVSRYAETKPTQKTNNRKGYGKVKNLSPHDARYLAMTDFEEE